MYNLPYFKEPNPEIVVSFIREHPFAVVCGCADNEPVATQLPLLIEQRGERLFLMGHMMRQTDHHLAFLKNQNVLVLFTGPHTYVSASWYTDPRQGSTWNYMTVQVKGTLKFIAQEHLPSILQRTTALFENNSSSPSLFEKLPDEYVQRMMKAIIPFEIEVTAINNVFKLSQNRDAESFDRIIEELMKGNADAQTIAAEMKKRKSELFSAKSATSRP